MLRQWIDDLTRDVAYGLRQLRRSPAFSAVVLTPLAVGIGARVTVSSIVDAGLLRPLASRTAGRLVMGWAATRGRPAEPAVFLPYRSYVAWKARSRSFDVVSATFRRAYLVSGQGDATTAIGMAVTDEFFSTLGLAPELGRTLSARDAGGPDAVVLSHGFWERHFGGSTAVIGAHVTLNGVPHEVVGGMPREFGVRLLGETRGLQLWRLVKARGAGR